MWTTRERIQYRIICLIVRPRKVSNAGNRVFKMFVSLWHLASASQMSEQLKNCNYLLHPFETLQNFMMRRLMWHWLANICKYIYCNNLWDWHGSTLIPAWIHNHMRCNMWDEMSYPFPNFNSCALICVVELCPYCFRYWLVARSNLNMLIMMKNAWFCCSY